MSKISITRCTSGFCCNSGRDINSSTLSEPELSKSSFLKRFPSRLISSASTRKVKLVIYSTNKNKNNQNNAFKIIVFFKSQVALQICKMDRRFKLQLNNFLPCGNLISKCWRHWTSHSLSFLPARALAILIRFLLVQRWDQSQTTHAFPILAVADCHVTHHRLINPSSIQALGSRAVVRFSRRISKAY